MTNILLWSLGAPEIIIILVVILLFFGGKKLPELAKGLGKGLKEFRNATKEDESTEDKNEKGNSTE